MNRLRIAKKCQLLLVGNAEDAGAMAENTEKVMKTLLIGNEREAHIEYLYITSSGKSKTESDYHVFDLDFETSY